MRLGRVFKSRQRPGSAHACVRGAALGVRGGGGRARRGGVADGGVADGGVRGWCGGGGCARGGHRGGASCRDASERQPVPVEKVRPGPAACDGRAGVRRSAIALRRPTDAPCAADGSEGSGVAAWTAPGGMTAFTTTASSAPPPERPAIPLPTRTPANTAPTAARTPGTTRSRANISSCIPASESGNRATVTAMTYVRRHRIREEAMSP